MCSKSCGHGAQVIGQILLGAAPLERAEPGSGRSTRSQGLARGESQPASPGTPPTRDTWSSPFAAHRPPSGRMSPAADSHSSDGRDGGSGNPQEQRRRSSGASSHLSDSAGPVRSASGVGPSKAAGSAVRARQSSAGPAGSMQKGRSALVREGSGNGSGQQLRRGVASNANGDASAGPLLVRNAQGELVRAVSGRRRVSSAFSKGNK